MEKRVIIHKFHNINWYYCVLSEDENEITVYNYEELCSFIGKEEIRGLKVTKDNHIKVCCCKVGIDFIELDSAHNLMLNKPVKIKGRVNGLRCFYKVKKENISESLIDLTAIFNIRFYKENDTVETNLEIVLDLVRTRPEYTVGQVYFDTMCKVYDELKYIMGTDAKFDIVRNIGNKFLLKDDVLDFSKLPIFGMENINNRGITINAKKLIFYSLDLSKVEGLYNPFGSINDINIIDLTNCYNDIVDKEPLKSTENIDGVDITYEYNTLYGKYKLNLVSKTFSIVIIKKECEVFRKVLLNSNPNLMDLGVMNKKEVENYAGKLVLLEKTGFYLAEV